MNHFNILTLLLIISMLNPFKGNSQVSVTGELKTWHKVTLEIIGPNTSETATPNPFLDYKLTGIFTQGSTTYEVPGYFAADGNAAETSASSGNIWKIHFAPPSAGTWNYTVRFRQGSNLAISNNVTGGTAINGIDNTTGSLSISATDKNEPDLRAKGQLRYVGGHHLQFAETGEYFMKAGPDSPEGFLSYEDIDNTPDISGLRKSWAPHAGDWNNGDPSWQNGKGTEIIGAINYLASKGMNTFSFITMNIGGDDKNVYPYVSTTERTRFDCSKLDQWEIIFNHGQNKGMHLHFKMMEQENDNLLDGGATGTERKAYVRELVARFGHHLALNWNLGEETRLETGEIQDFATYMKDTDPYDHHIVIHTSITQQDLRYGPLLGNASELTGISLQTDWNDVHSDTERWIASSSASGKKWVVANDEQGPSNRGVPNDEYTGSPDKDDIRHQTLWGNIMAGGAGVEYYFGIPTSDNDMNAQDYRTRDQSWDYCRHALNFCNNYIPFWEMSNANSLSSNTNDYVLAKTDGDAVYVIYLPSGGSTNIDVSDASGDLEIKWYDPRNGGSLQNGSITSASGGSTINTGTPPNNTSSDWVVLITSSSSQPCNNEPSSTPPSDITPGINYKYFEGSWNSLPNFDSLTPVDSGRASAINLDNAIDNDYFGLTFDGYINIPNDGSYIFYANSDDGSGIWIDGNHVVNNDGLHGAQEVSGSICLEAGYHEIRVEFFEKTGGNVLSVAYAGPGISKTTSLDLYGTSENTTIDQVITFPDLSNKVLGDVDFNPGATASSGLPISYTSSNSQVATIVNGNIKITGIGTTTITASQAGNSNYNPAPNVSKTLIVLENNERINLALNGNATQSSTDYQGIAERAIDGNTSGEWSDGSVTHTANENNPWWQVDLGATNSIDEIVIFNRTSCCMDRLTNFTISVIESNGNISFSQSFTSYPDPSVTVNAGGVNGSIVKVQLNDNGYLSLAEVEVYSGVSNIEDNTITLQENETGFCLVDGSIDSNHAGHTGTGFANTQNVLGNGINWKIDGSSGSYTFSWRYASTSNRPANLLVDGTIVSDDISFNSTGAWTSWATTASITVNLPDGIKDIRLESSNQLGLANIDYMEVTGPNIMASSCTINGGDCSDFFNGITVRHINPGCSNNDGQIIVTYQNSDAHTQIQLSIDGGRSYPVTVNDNSGSYSFTGLNIAEYELAARYANNDCEYNIAHVNLVEDCGEVSLTPGGVSWHDSYEANGFCWCSTNFDHELDTKVVTINGTPFSVEDICDELEKHPLFRARNSGDNIYNDVQCGNGPLNNSDDEPICPGRVDQGSEGCLLTGVRWDMEWLASRDRFQGANKASINAVSAVYPNPTAKGSYVSIITKSNILSVKLFDMMGQSKEIPLLSGNKIAINNESSGLYLLVITFLDGSKQASKLLIE